jgi:metallo-beta-lactamase class B
MNCRFTKHYAFKPKKIYKTNDLIITQISENSYTHISYKQTNDFGNVTCNGLIVKDKNEVIIFDTPTNDKSAAELIQWIKETLHCKINAIIPTHFHDDCLGGLKVFTDNNIPSYANFKTIELAK